MISGGPLGKTMHHFKENMFFSDMFRFNLFSGDIEFIKSPTWEPSVVEGDTLCDQNITHIRYYLSSIHNFEPQKSVVGEACMMVSKNKSYHPVKKYIEKEEWDGVRRIDEWLNKSVGCVNNIYTSQAGAKFLIATVSRIYNPGCKFDYMLILEGDQGIGKSTMIEEMASSWYLDTNFGHKDKDLIDAMRGAFIIEISELSGMNKKDVDWLKSFLSKKVDRVRLPYEARSKDFKRKCVFVGTYNPSGDNMYLRDDTGNRRFWPIECKGFIDLEYIRKNKAQLWAESLVRFRDGEQLYIDDQDALDILAGVHKDRELQSPTYYTIKDWLKGRGDLVSN